MAPIFDEKGALERCDEDKDLLSEIVSIFFEEYESQLSDLKKQASAGDGYNLARTAHAIKSALGNIGATRAFEIAREIETLGKGFDKDVPPDAAQSAHVQKVGLQKISELAEAVTLFREAAKEYWT